MAKNYRRREVKLVCQTCGKITYKKSYYRLYDTQAEAWEDTMREIFPECLTCWKARKRREWRNTPPTCTIENIFLAHVREIDLDRRIRVRFVWDGYTTPIKRQLKRLGFEWDGDYEYVWYRHEMMTLVEAAKIMRKVKRTEGLYLSEHSKKILSAIEKKAERTGQCV